MSAAILPTLTSHPSSFVFVESLQLWPQISQTVFALIDLEGKKNKPHTCDISIHDNTVRLLDLFPGCAYSCLCDKLDVIFFLKQLRAIKRSLMMILG